MFTSPPFDQMPGTTLGNYRLEQLIGQSALGPLYLSRSQDGTGTTYLLRILALPSDLTPEARTTYLTRFQRQVEHLATLQHPYILPLLDYGVHASLPYLVWPGVSLRSLSARLAQSGPPDVVTVGRYLDQIAAALEYAHEHATLHRNLTTDCIYIQLDGHLVVADFGVRRLIELSYEDAPSHLLYGPGEAYTPEQILGQHIDTYTDIYSLGATLFRLLTGSPVFAADRRDDLIQLHLRAPVPPIATRRSGLPAALDGIIATAMAKEPERRFSRPGAVANAYQQVVAPHNAARVPFITTSSPGPETRQPPVGATPSATSRRPGTTGGPALAGPGMGGQPPLRGPSMTPSGGRPPVRRNGGLRLALFALVILALVGGTTFTLVSLANSPGVAAHATGQVTFLDGQNHGPGYSDAVRIVARNLDAPPNGYQYDAWLINERSEHVIALGTLTAQGRTFALDDPGDGQNGQPGTNLLADGDKIEITVERGQVNLPVGRTVLSGTFPRQAIAHIRHLLVSFPTTPGQVGLLVGMRDQIQLADAEAQALQVAVTGHDAAATECADQSLIDILEGQHGAHYKPLASACSAHNASGAGDGFGVLGTGEYLGTVGYLAKAAEHTSNAAIAPDATDAIRQHAASIETAISTIKGWLATADGDAVTLLKNPGDATVASEIATLADHADHGVDANGDGQIDPVAGEAGVVTALTQAEAMPALTLAADS